MLTIMISDDNGQLYPRTFYYDPARNTARCSFPDQTNHDIPGVLDFEMFLDYIQRETKDIFNAVQWTYITNKIQPLHTDRGHTYFMVANKELIDSH